jgi:hypothetical protein
VSPAVLAALILLRLIFLALNDRDRGGRAPAARRSSGRTIWSLLVYLVIAPTALALILVGWGQRSPASVAAGLGLSVLVFPWLVARAVTIPLGMVRTSYCLARIAEHTWAADRRGGAALAAAWAALRRRRPAPRARAFLERRLEGASRPLRGAGIVAAGLLAAERGDVAGARELLQGVDSLSPLVVPRVARRVAAEWRAAEAAERGAWAEVVDIGAALAARSRATRLLAAIGRRLRGEIPTTTAMARLGLWLRWAATPRRRALYPLLRRALDATPPSPPPARKDDPLPGDNPAAPPDARGGPDGGPYRVAASVAATAERLATALAEHAALLAEPLRDLDPTRLFRVALAWDRALADPETRRAAGQRAAALGASSSDATLVQLGRAAQADLAALALAAELPLAPPETGAPPECSGGVTATGVARLLRERLLGDVESAARALESRVRADRVHPPLEEWREWCTLRRLYLRAGRMGGLSLRRLVYVEVHDAACPLAVKLWNTRGQRALANAIFTWLQAEAVEVGNSGLAAHEIKNVSCGVG